MCKHRELSLFDLIQPFFRPSSMASETLVLTHRPFYKPSLYNVQRTFHGRLVVCAKIVHPPANCWIYGLCDHLNLASAPSVEFHSLDLVFQRLTRFLAYRRKEVPLESSESVFYERFSKSIAKEVKLGAYVVSDSILILAVDDLCFLRM